VAAGFVVAIDGPAGSGKSTTAKLCARRLGFLHLDTGAMYRAITLNALDTNTRIDRPAELGRMLRSTRIDLEWRAGRMRVRLDGRDVSRAIRAPQVSDFVSEVSAIPAVRRKLVAEQRRAAAERSVVCEGRDIGSVVFPDAGLKVYLDCAVDARAGRRLKELGTAGRSAAAVRANLVKRDRIDSGRKMSPLVRTPDAVLVDTTDLTIEEQVAVVCDLARRRLARQGR
jgi:cytidylate kinase